MGYIGAEGYCIASELREGSQHCRKGAPAFLKCFPARASELCQSLMLLRLDGGNDSLDNVDVVLEHNESVTDTAKVDFIINRGAGRWNPRKESAEQWLDYAVENASRRASRG
jgi:hypothetical protein